MNKGITLLLLVALALPVVAAEELPEPRIGVDNVLYGPKLGLERLMTALTFSDERRAERLARLADYRLAEAQNATGGDRVRALERYQALQGEALVTAARADLEDASDGNVTRRIVERFETRERVLSDVLEQVPEDAKPAIRDAILRADERRENVKAVMGVR